VYRTFIENEGTRWIVDYKTAEPSGEEIQEEFVAAQLENYCKLFYAREELNIRCTLYFTLMQRLVELD